MKNKLQTFLLAVSVCVVSTVALWAQSGGSLTGRITDSSGSSVPNAKVELENVSSGQRISTTTASDGTYSFNDVPSGTYRLINLGTTSPSSSDQVMINPGGSSTTNFTMPSGPGTEVLVQADTVNTSTASASIQNSFNTRWIQYLPQPNFLDRDGTIYGAYNLSLLSEGISQSPYGERGPALGGNRPGTNNYHIDGIDNNNKVVTGPLVYLPNEATTEFTLFLNQNSPVFGQSVGGKFNSTMRTGSNQLHGSFYDYFQNRNLNAMDRRLAFLGYNENPRYDQNRLGASVGIPVIPSKFFFFGNFEYIPLGFSQPLSNVAYAPTAAGFALLGRTPGISASNLGILQASTGTVADATRFTVINGASVPLGLVNSNVNGYRNQYIGAGSGDWNFTDKDQLHMRYVHNEGESNTSGAGLPAFTTPQRNKNLFASIAHYHTFGSTLTNELRFGFNRYAQFYDPANFAFGSLGTLPNISIGGASNLALGPQFGNISNAALNTYHVADGIAWRWRGNNFRIGFDGRRYLGYEGGFASARGNYSYSTLGRFLADLPPDVVSQRSFGGNRFDLNQWLLMGYVTDTWNITSKIVLDLGLRYQYLTIPSGFDYQQRNNIASTTGVINFNDISNQDRNFAPHVGIAYSPFDNRITVLRAGFGMDYDAFTASRTMIGFDPSYSRQIYGNELSNTPGFLANGGIVDPLANTANITAAQARALTTSWSGGLHLPYAMQWHAGIQQGIWHKLTIEAKYLGNKSVHLPFYERLNALNGITATNSLPLYLTAPSQATLNTLPFTLNTLALPPAGDPFSGAGFTSPITAVNWGGNSWYHAGVVNLRHAFTGGLQVMANYTYSQWTEDTTGTLSDLVSLGRQRTWSVYDTRHSASVTGMFEVAPLFRNTYSIVRNVFADVNVNGTYTFASGQYLPLTSGSDVTLSGSALGAGVFYNASGTPGVGSGVTPLTNSAGQVVAYLATNPNAQYIAGGQGQFPTNGRRGIGLPDTHNFDVAAVKRFNWRDRFSVEARGEAYNVLNRSIYSLNSVTNLGSQSFAAIPGFLTPGNPEFNTLTSSFSGNPRRLQVALRVVF